MFRPTGMPLFVCRSPVGFVPWLVNWDIGYYDNSSDLEKAIKLSDPDLFEWDFGSENNREHVLTRQGVLVSSHQSYEWQQTSGAPDSNAAFKRNFKGNGFGVDETGKLEKMHPDRGNLSDFMVQIAPKWHALTKEGNIRAVKYGQTVTQDNIGNYFGVYHDGGDILPQDAGFSWGPWINTKFVEYYTTKSSVARGAAATAGRSLPQLPNGTSFRLVDYVAARRRSGSSALALTRDPILHEYIRFVQNATVARWADMRTAAKAQAAKALRPYPLAVCVPCEVQF